MGDHAFMAVSIVVTRLAYHGHCRHINIKRNGRVLSEMYGPRLLSALKLIARGSIALQNFDWHVRVAILCACAGGGEAPVLLV
jgi:hypothetical protein